MFVCFKDCGYTLPKYFQNWFIYRIPIEMAIAPHLVWIRLDTCVYIYRYGTTYLVNIIYTCMDSIYTVFFVGV